MTEILERRFHEMGARVKVRALPERGRFTINPRLDVERDKEGEIFDIVLPEGTAAEVVNVDPKDRHLLLLLRSGGIKSKFLCGHDERHWFVAAIPESAPNVTDVRKAKLALQPPAVRARLSKEKVKPKNTLRRRNEAYKRQGEWFFVPIDGEPPFFDEKLLLRNEPLLRSGRASKPHMMEFCFRSGGTTVIRAGSKVFSEGEWNRMSREAQRRFPSATRMTRDMEVWAKGRISHGDHATIVLDGWHRVEMNEEQRARAMSHVVFLD
jgi:hypothetical protein